MISGQATGLWTNVSGEFPFPAMGKALSCVVSGPPGKSLHVSQLSGLFLRSNSYPRKRGLDFIHSPSVPVKYIACQRSCLK